VFYLNGTEVYRLRMPAAPAVIGNATIADGFPCDGDATCPESFTLSGPVVAANLLAGDNVLAAEVHNYNVGSPDITFGLAANYTVPYVPQPTLDLTSSEDSVTLSWSQGGFTLQQAESPAGPWGNVPGPVVSSPFTTNISNATLFFRLRR